jgi:hypothetical protein
VATLAWDIAAQSHMTKQWAPQSSFCTALLGDDHLAIGKVD